MDSIRPRGAALEAPTHLVATGLERRLETLGDLCARGLSRLDERLERGLEGPPVDDLALTVYDVHGGASYTATAAPPIRPSAWKSWLGLGFWGALFFAAAAPAGAQTGLQSSLALPSTSLTFSAAYVAADLGLWAKEGLDMKVVNIAGVGAPNAVIAGSVDFTVTTASTFARAAGRGERMLVIANLLDRPMMELVLRKDVAEQSGFDSTAPVAERAKALRGRTIAVDGIYTNLHGLLLLVARKGGLDPETDLRVAPMPAPNMPAALQSKAIDGFSSSLPWTIGAVADGEAVMVASSPNGDLPELLPFAYSVVMTRPALCRDRREICAKAARGFAAAAAMIRGDAPEALAVLRKRFPTIGEAVLARSLATIRAATPAVPRVDPAALANAERFSVAAGMVKPDETVKSFDGLYTDEFLR